ncbi:hypothetical protein HOP50_06g43550 [Chloropicon primus]|uniref:Transcription factor Pcc1 n=1 Tax=Chloropicon primus TaxID=1764295 RepID=A0A5B8MP66_9CHLO|nr:hypothetical protein A3770_06p43320 [Chloropicon primus]UPR01034.1 hypothetical protein HOP50_06g43550 [Chloropicon primus]|eukprot:QDZ21814.1 hypothetical protein A3770_06p43320 [Chloropicon primus]
MEREWSETGADASKPHHFEARIKTTCHNDAVILRTSLMVDKELNPTKVHRSIEIDEEDDTLLVIKLDATEVRLMRPAISTLMDLAEAASKAIEAFAH